VPRPDTGSGTVECVATPEPRSIRIGTAEREQAVKALGEHFAQGRLEPAEFEERMTAAYAARTASELDRLFDDLPSAHRATGQHPTGPYPAAHGTAQVPTGGYPTGAFPAVFPSAPYIGGHLVPHQGYDPHAPYGRDPVSGFPYSDRSKVVAGLLQLFLPIGVGRMYAGHTGIGVAQLLLTLFFGIGMVWAFIDGIVILAGRPTDGRGRPLRP
jgi:hypothetical protein